MKLLFEIIAIILVGAGLGLAAAHFRLFRNPWAVISLGIIIIALIVYGLHLQKKLGEEEDWPD